MTKLVLAGLMIGLMFQMPAFAAEEEATAEQCQAADASVGQGETGLQSSESADSAEAGTWDLHHTHWHFITCVHTQAECAWEARYHRYVHWYASHDHRYCRGHAHLACFGGHH